MSHQVESIHPNMAGFHNINVSHVGHSKDLSINDIPLSCRHRLCDHLDELNVWSQLAECMSLKEDEVQRIRRQQSIGNSPTQELLNIWGGQYGHTVTELFFVLRNLKLYPAMRLLKDKVKRDYHVLIPDSQPTINKNSHGQSLKIHNCSTSSGVSNSNNADSNSENNNSSSIYSSGTHSDSSSVNQSNTLSERKVKEFASSMLEINYQELADATHNWCESFILGKGGFGTVFKGYWKYTDVAIKQIHYRGANDRESVKVQIQQSLNELKFLNSCRHDNVLPLYGYSIKGEKPCLVYQLMTNGSLEQRLNDKKIAPLSWKQRIEICLGTARGINFLHTFREKPLIHGDIKPANILLDQCWQPKIGDFGLAREGPNTINSAVEVTQVFGTKPYLPPEFLNSKKLSTKVDTYSFGVVLLETFTGMRAYDKNRSNPMLTKHIKVYASTNDYQIEILIDKNIPLPSHEEGMCKNAIFLGLKCIADSPQQRPEMERVLEAIRNNLSMHYFQL